MSLKRRILPRVRKSEANSAPVPMRVIVLPDKAKGLRINCPGCFIVITRTETGTQVVVERNFGHVLGTRRSFESDYCTVDNTVTVEVTRANPS